MTVSRPALRPWFALLAGIAVVLATAALPGSAPRAAGDGDISLLTAAKRAGTFNQFLLAARQTGLDGELSSEGPWTIFAPTDASVGKLPDHVWFKLMQPENRELLRAVVRFHMVPGEYPPQRLLAAKVDEYTIPGAGGPVLINKTDGKIKVSEDVSTSETFIAASNGLLLEIDHVLIPSDVAAELKKL